MYDQQQIEKTLSTEAVERELCFVIDYLRKNKFARKPDGEHVLSGERVEELEEYMHLLERRFRRDRAAVPCYSTYATLSQIKEVSTKKKRKHVYVEEAHCAVDVDNIHISEPALIQDAFRDIAKVRRPQSWKTRLFQRKLGVEEMTLEQIENAVRYY